MRHQNFLISFFLAILTLLLVVSCQRSPSDTETSSKVETPSNFQVAMLLSGSKEDESWSQAGYEGLRAIEKNYQAQIAYQEYVSNVDSEEVMRKYAREGYDFIIGHSGGYINSAEIVAQEFPRTKFALITTYPGNNHNLGAVGFRSGEVGYLTGLLAAMKTKSNKVAYVVGENYPVYQEEATLFKRGAEATNQSIEVFTKFLGTWTDEEKATKVALDLLAAGVDIFAFNADEAGVAAIKTVTKKEGIYVIGWTKDQYELAPDRILTSVLQDIPQLILNAATLMQQGRWEGKLYKFGLKEKIYDFAPFRGMLTPEEEAAFNTARNRVITGEIEIYP
ncbi:BMP family protein [Oscillatoria salina]|uniref:BMP family protein n=1 Tax=Oscillatoria salina TaxID=331517 RepID=UPI001CCBB989|nr:BMP family protein [Oscillatoria salina]MBZ8178821.1 BMP family ABC transporter substrate-binding protein [Oscillatoria salina IIICB1]